MGRKHKKKIIKELWVGRGGGLVPHVSRKIHWVFFTYKKMNVERTVPRSPFFWNNVKVNIEDWRSRIALIPSKTM